VTQPSHLDSFNAYKAALAATMRPHFGPSTRGVAVLLNTRHQTVDVVCYHAGEGVAPEESLTAVVREAVAALPALFGLSATTRSSASRAATPRRRSSTSAAPSGPARVPSGSSTLR
jgi:hypothetical protein